MVANIIHELFLAGIAALARPKIGAIGQTQARLGSAPSSPSKILVTPVAPVVVVIHARILLAQVAVALVNALQADGTHEIETLAAIPNDSHANAAMPTYTRGIHLHERKYQ